MKAALLEMCNDHIKLFESAIEAILVNITTMNSLRVARAALRTGSVALRTSQLAKRTYADVAPDKIQLTLALPHQVRLR